MGIAQIRIAGKRYTVKKRFYFIVAAVVLLVLAAVLVPLFFHYFYPTRGTTPVRVRIEEGDTVGSIAAQLESKGIITSASIFRMMAWFGSREGKIKAGDYMLYPGMHYGEVFDALEQGSKVVARVTIPEGFTEEQVAARIGNTGAMTSEELLTAAREGGYGLSWLPPGQEGNLEGFLFPKTYDLLEGMGPHDVVSMLVAQFQAETAGLDWGLTEQFGITPYQAVVAASIIEREVVVPEERPLVAAVIYNRLKKGMRLQMCSTVQYLLPEQKDILTYEDLEIVSPYNTYQNAGLPPAPICNPGLASIEAALHPAQVGYLYFVATGEGNRHFFTADYNEFLRAKQQAQN
jgi:UPF0755 protein